jgi:hypothetical protein
MRLSLVWFAEQFAQPDLGRFQLFLSRVTRADHLPFVAVSISGHGGPACTRSFRMAALEAPFH